MIPNFISNPRSLWSILPPGIHDASMPDVYDRFVYNDRRKRLYEGLERGLDNLFASGCIQVYLDGSYVTEKPLPGDYDLCWDSTNVDPDKLDPVFLQHKSLHKAKYLGEYFPSWISDSTGQTFVDFFQKEKDTGTPKGIIRIKNYLVKGGIYDN